MHFRKAKKCGRVKHLIIGLGLIVFNTTFNNISVILWWPVLWQQVKMLMPPLFTKMPLGTFYQNKS
jgi:hypothetical protein